MSHGVPDQPNKSLTGISFKELQIRHVENSSPLQKPQSSQSMPSAIGTGRKMFLIKGNKVIPVTATITRTPNTFKRAESGEPLQVMTTDQSPPLPKEIKKEPADEETVTAIANITDEKPLNLADLLSKAPPTSGPKPTISTVLPKSNKVVPLENNWKQKHNGHLSEEVYVNPEDGKLPSTSSVTLSTQKRNRKPTKRCEYIYENPEDEEVQKEPIIKKQRVVEQGCRCEYIVPELEKRMDRMMEQIRMVETLAKTLSMQAGQRDAEDRKKNEQIQRLKQQLEENREFPHH